MIITVLGSCANQTDIREGVAILVESNENKILIDAGPGIVSSICKIKAKASEIDNVILTHAHGDHISGIAYFVWQRHYETLGTDSVANELNIYGLSNCIELSRFMIDQMYGLQSFPFNINFIEIEPDVEKQIDNTIVQFVNAKHPTECVSVVLDDKSGKMAFSSDTLPVDDFINYALNANILIHEGMWTENMRELADKTMHSTAKDASLVATKTKAKQLVLTHIFPKYIGRENEILLEAKENYSGNISIPFDGTKYII